MKFLMNVPVKIQKPIKFLLTGMLNTLFGYGVLLLLLALDLHYALAGLLSTIMGVLFNFKSYGFFVFKNKNNRLIFKFIVAYCFTYALFVMLMFLLSGLLHVDKYASAAVAMLTCSLVSYFVNLLFVYGDQA